MTQVAPIIGFHGGNGGNHNGIGAYFTQVDAAGVPFALCSIGNAGLVAEALSHTNADHFVLYRQNDDANGGGLDIPFSTADRYTESAESYASRYTNTLNRIPEIVANKARVWIGILNEPDQTQSEWLNQFCLNVAKIMNADGWRVCVLNWSTGTPFLHSIAQPHSVAMLRYAAANRDKCAIGIHEYALSQDLFNNYPFLAGRWKFFAHVCERLGIPEPLFAVKEFGWENNLPSPAVALNQLRDFFEQDKPDMPRMIWCLQEWLNTHHQAQRLIAPLTHMIVNERFSQAYDPIPEAMLPDLGDLPVDPIVTPPPDEGQPITPPAPPVTPPSGNNTAQTLFTAKQNALSPMFKAAQANGDVPLDTVTYHPHNGGTMACLLAMTAVGTTNQRTVLYFAPVSAVNQWPQPDAIVRHDPSHN